jgi:hypothetical protein
LGVASGFGDSASWPTNVRDRRLRVRRGDVELLASASDGAGIIVVGREHQAESIDDVLARLPLFSALTDSHSFSVMITR